MGIIKAMGENIRKGIRSWLQIQSASPYGIQISEVMDFELSAIRNRIWYRGDGNLSSVMVAWSAESMNTSLANPHSFRQRSRNSTNFTAVSEGASGRSRAALVNCSRPLPEWEDETPQEIRDELKEEPKPGWVHWFFSFVHNLGLPEEKLQKILQNTPKGTKIWKNKIQGLRGKATGLVFPNFDRKEHAPYTPPVRGRPGSTSL